MVFSSTIFLFCFLPVVWAIYTIVPRRFIFIKNVILALASTVFYAYGEPVYILILLASVTFNYFMAIALEKNGGNARRAIGTGTVVVNLSLLVLFKYVPWLVGLVNTGLSLHLPIPALTIPIGISFYTFQILSYVIDVYRGRVKAQRSYIDLYLYISFFPQLIAGPIVKYDEIADQIAAREISLSQTSRGVKRFIFGLAKKVLISNTAAVIAEAAFGSVSPSSALAWSGAVCYSLQLYFDFSGYSDMAIGLASIFGFELNENFRYPFFATSICDFWKRWHISLTSWFREYVYFPLGGSRVSKPRAMFNRFLIFFLSGLWHGANLTYIVWGLWHGILMVFEQTSEFDRLTRIKAVRPLTRLYTLLAVVLGFVVFRASSLQAAFTYIGRMFSFTGTTGDATLFFTPWTIVVLAFGVLLSCPTVPYLKEKISKIAGERTVTVVSYAVAVLLFILSVGSLVSSTFNPFIYYIF